MRQIRMQTRLMRLLNQRPLELSLKPHRHQMLRRGAGSESEEPSSTFSPPPSLPEKVQPLTDLPHASPAIRRFARELGADLTRITGSAAKGRITREDVQKWVKKMLADPPAAKGSAIPAIPEVDFSRFGEIETVALSRIKKLSGPHLQRAWLNIPHVTQHEEADITELEAFRQSLKEEAAKEPGCACYQRGRPQNHF